MAEHDIKTLRGLAAGATHFTAAEQVCPQSEAPAPRPTQQPLDSLTQIEIDDSLE